MIVSRPIQARIGKQIIILGVTYALTGGKVILQIKKMILIGKNLKYILKTTRNNKKWYATTVQLIVGANG